MPTLAGAWRKLLVFILDLDKSIQWSWSISTSTAGAYARNRGNHMWLFNKPLIQWLQLSTVPCQLEPTMACIGGTIIVEALRATLGQVIILAPSVLPPINFPPGSQSAPLAMPRFLEGPVIEWAWRVFYAAVTTHWFHSAEENQASSLVGWDIPIASIPIAKIDGTAVEGILKRTVPFQKITTWYILASTIQTVTHQDQHSKHRLLTWLTIFSWEFQVVQLLSINMLSSIICHLSFFFQSVPLSLTFGGWLSYQCLSKNLTLTDRRNISTWTEDRYSKGLDLQGLMCHPKGYSEAYWSVECLFKKVSTKSRYNMSVTV